MFYLQGTQVVEKVFNQTWVGALRLHSTWLGALILLSSTGQLGRAAFNDSEVDNAAAAANNGDSHNNSQPN